MEVKELTQDYAKKVMKASRGIEVKVKAVKVNSDFSLERNDGSVDFGNAGDLLIQKGDDIAVMTENDFKKIYM